MKFRDLNAGPQGSTLLDEDAGSTQPRGQERIQSANCEVEEDRRGVAGFLQLKEFSKGYRNKIALRRPFSTGIGITTCGLC